MSVRTTTLKVKNTNSKLELFRVFKDYTAVCSHINHLLYEMAQRTFKNKDGNVVITEDQLVKRLETQLDRSLTDSERKALQTVFLDFSNAFNARDFSNAFTLPIREKVLKEDDEKSGKKSGEVKTLDSESLVLCKKTFPNLFPFSVKGMEFDILIGQSGYKYAVFGTIHNRLTSYDECDKACNKEYVELQQEVTGISSLLISTYSQEQFDLLFEWLKEVETRFSRSPEKLSQFSINWKFLSFFKEVLQPSLLAWNSNKSIVVSNKGVWKSKTGTSINYSCGEYVIESLKSFPELWNTKTSILLYNRLGEYIELNERFHLKKEHSSFKEVDLHESPVKLFLGNNYVNINDLQHDVANGMLSITIGYPKSSSKDNKKDKMTLECSYRRTRRGTHHYLEGLVVEETKNEKDKLTGNFKLSFKVNGKRDRVALLKEPSIRLVVRNQNMDVENPKLSDFDFYVDLTMNVEPQVSHGIDEKDLWKYRAEFSKAFPEKKNFGNQKTLTKEEVKIPDGIKVMGVDLGLKNPYAFAVYEYNSSGNHTLVDSGITQPCDDDDYYKQYSEFGYLCENIRRVISNTKRHVNDGEDLEEGLFKAVQTQLGKFSRVIGSRTYSFEDYKSFVSDKKKANVTLIHFKNDEEWVVRQWVTLCRKIKIHLTNERFRRFSDWRKHFFWIRGLESYRKMFTSFFKLGSASRTKGFTEVVAFKSVYDEINNLKLDYIKKMTSEVAQVAKKNNVALVVVEELENLRGNKFDDRDKNQLFNLWPVGQIKKFLEDSLALYGILVGNAFEGNTSQVDADTGEWGSRGEKEDIDSLYLSDDKVVNADVNAAKNLCLRYMGKHTDFRTLSLYKVNDNFYVPTISLDEKDSKRVSGFLTKRFGHRDVVFQKSGDVLVLSNTTLQDLKKKSKLENLSKETWYATDNTFSQWITREQRDAYINSIRK